MQDLLQTIQSKRKLFRISRLEVYTRARPPHFSLFLNARPVVVYHQLFENQDLVLKGCQQWLNKEIQDRISGKWWPDCFAQVVHSPWPTPPPPLRPPSPLSRLQTLQSIRGIIINKRAATTTDTYKDDHNNNNQPADHPVLFLLAGCWALNAVAGFQPIFRKNVKCCQSSFANISPKFP